jgi:transcriptional regulator of NAD metabolism
MAAFLKGLFAFFSALPELLRLLEKLGELKDQSLHEHRVRADLTKFEEATTLAVKEKDTRALNSIFPK